MLFIVIFFVILIIIFKKYGTSVYEDLPLLTADDIGYGLGRFQPIIESMKKTDMKTFNITFQNLYLYNDRFFINTSYGVNPSITVVTPEIKKCLNPVENHLYFWGSFDLHYNKETDVFDIIVNRVTGQTFIYHFNWESPTGHFPGGRMIDFLVDTYCINLRF